MDTQDKWGLVIIKEEPDLPQGWEMIEHKTLCFLNKFSRGLNFNIIVIVWYDML